jgi:ABC-type branched-subunit amino acid transport system substrate-binding protein
VRASYGEEMAAIVGHLVKVRRLRADQIAVFAQEDAFGESGFAAVAKAMRTLETDPRLLVRLGYRRNTVDVERAMAALAEREAPVRAVVMVATSRAAANFVQRVREQYPRTILATGSFVNGAALAQELSAAAPRHRQGVIVTRVVPPVVGHSTVVLDYKAALARYFPDQRADDISFEGYLTARVLIEGLHRTGPRLDTERLVAALEEMHDYDLGLGTTLGFGPADHQASHEVWGTQLDEAGHYQVIDLK